MNHPAALTRNAEPRPFPVWAGQALALIALENGRFCLALVSHRLGRRLAKALHV